MKALLTLGLILSPLSWAGASLDSLPHTLQCKALVCVYGDADFCQVNDFSQIQLHGLNQTTGIHWVGVGEGKVVIGDYDDKIILNFSLEESDQYSTFAFRKDDMDKLHRGLVPSINGLYEDSYDWADGSHTRAMFVVECKV